MGCLTSKPKLDQCNQTMVLPVPNLDQCNQTMVLPVPNFVMKTQRLKSTDKLFINVCTSELIRPFPSILVGVLRLDVGKRGDKCQVVDVVIHPAGKCYMKFIKLLLF